jgi:hypothetical protein
MSGIPAFIVDPLDPDTIRRDEHEERVHFTNIIIFLSDDCLPDSLM